ncbi:putative Cytochrome P450 [Hibiscus syriacus]|uniref:Cytochrome P450 n=1 Tax=Hibiscus syriacus TaxID=106335 RepID=A0A6A3D186_HIBSY|nr:putative Cytochrome P450 [Hibiscus syriacus]
MSLVLTHYYFQYLIWFITVVVVHSFIKTILKPAGSPFHQSPSSGHLCPTQIFPRPGSTLWPSHGDPPPCISLPCIQLRCCIRNIQNPRAQFLFQARIWFLGRGSRLVAVPQLDKFADIRYQENVKLVESVMNCCKKGKTCKLSSKFTALTNNTICRMAISTRCSGRDNDAAEIKELIHTCLKLSGKIIVGDVLGPLKVLDFSGNEKKLKAALLKYDRLVERIIKEHEEKVSEGFYENQKMDLLDILLEVYRDPTAEVKISMKDIKSFLLVSDIFMAGTDTSSSAMQWAMGELINNPTAFKKLRDEIDSVAGSNRLVKESDIPNLPYHRVVIREILRLHPSAPLIIRECGEDCNVNGYLVKAKTRVLVVAEDDYWIEQNRN